MKMFKISIEVHILVIIVCKMAQVINFKSINAIEIADLQTLKLTRTLHFEIKINCDLTISSKTSVNCSLTLA